jgi:uncharacterized protein YmfQ (DUF2313 family)
MLDFMPPYYAEDESVHAVMIGLGNELDRVQAAGEAVRNAAFPQMADDTHGLLRMWERLVGLPEAPTGISVAARQQKVVASLRMRKTGAGKDWVALMSAALGTDLWTYDESDPYEIHVFIPFASGTYSATQVAQIARAITPAAWKVIVNYEPNFIVGVNEVGDEL